MRNLQLRGKLSLLSLTSWENCGMRIRKILSKRAILYEGQKALADLREDELKFVDMASSVMWLGTEERIFDGNR